jgi:ubiquinone/menaquinone biosynthesis C-methylase UbiE
MRGDLNWLFDLGADVYGWFTAQAIWRASCRALAAELPPGGEARIRVADLGCGPGVSTFAIARARPGSLVVGLDLAPRMLGEARGRAAALGRAQARRGRLAWVRGDVVRLPFATGSLDAVTGHSFLYLLPDRAAALAEMRRVLRGGGRLVLMEPSSRPATVRGVLRLGRDPRHLVAVALWRPFSRVHGRFSPETLAEALSRAGFVDCRVSETLGGIGLLARADKPAPAKA